MADIEETLRFFSNARFLRMLDSDGRRKLLSSAEPKSYADGESVFEEGEPGDALYIIVSGIATVVADDMGNEKAVAELTDGAFFGEMAVITSQPRSASVRARGELSALRIPKQAVLDKVILAGRSRNTELVLVTMESTNEAEARQIVDSFIRNYLLVEGSNATRENDRELATLEDERKLLKFGFSWLKSVLFKGREPEQAQD